MKKILLLSIFIVSVVFAKDNVSLSRSLLKFQGDEYNMLLFPKEVVVVGKKKKTRRAINKGYKRAISELTRQVRLRNLDVNIKIFTHNGSTLPQYKKEDKKSYELLKNMMQQQIALRKQLFLDAPVKKSDNQQQTIVQSADDVNIDDLGDEDYGDDAYDISADEANIDDGSGKLMKIDAESAFISGYSELVENYYNEEVLSISKAKHPFDVNGMVKMKNVHTVFGMAFFPTKYGSIKMMNIYVVLCNIKTEEDDAAQIIVKEIPNFKWDRNYLYISAATGKMLRQIISGILGESLSVVY